MATKKPQAIKKAEGEKPRKPELAGFWEFIREHGVVGLAVGVMMGAAVSEVVKSIVDGLLNPFVGLIVRGPNNLDDISVEFLGSVFKIGHVISTLLDLIIVSAIVYFAFKALKLEKFEKK